MERFKEELLEHYKQKEPNLFVQYDGFDFTDSGGDDFMKPDEDGHCLFSTMTYELMSGAANVRVLITPQTPKETILKLLDKIKLGIKSDLSKEVEKSNKLREAEGELLKIFENGYTQHDIEYLFDSIKTRLDKKRQETEEMPGDIVGPENIPF